MATQKRYLDLAARLALRGAGRVEPNPMVGCVLVRDGRVVGLGHHRRFGGAHAEAEALRDCGARGESPRGAEAYVTLEPCNGHGQQPPCSEALISAGISRVVFAVSDANPHKSGGAERLRAAGVTVERCGESVLAGQLARPFLKRLGSRSPWVIAKWAQTIDGRIATRTGESKWISSERSRARVHRLRARVDAILTGIGTVIADDPMLTARGVCVRRLAVRVVADADLDIPLDSGIVRTARELPTIVACDGDLALSAIMADKRRALERAGVEVVGVPAGAGGRGIDLGHLLRSLGRARGLWTAMVESGPGLLGSLFEQDLVDEAWVYVAPMLLGDELAASVAVGRVAETLSAGRRFTLLRAKQIGDDVELLYRRRERAGGA